MSQTNPDDPRRPNVGCGVVIFRTGPVGLEVLLIVRGLPPRQGEWSIPGGRQHWGETLHEAARREVLEETGVVVGDLTLVDVVDSITRDDNGDIGRHLALVDYCAPWVSGTPRAGDDAADARWIPVAEVDSYVVWEETQRVIHAAAKAFTASL